MIAKFIAQMFPKQGEPPRSDGFSIRLYRCEEKAEDNPLAVDWNGEDLYHKEFTVLGNFLPSDKYSMYELEGKWQLNKNRGDYGYRVENCKPIIEKSKNGIMEYLIHNINGIGPKIAERIYDAFGDETLDILDKDIDRLREIKGISENKKQSIWASYIEKRACADLMVELLPLGLSRNKILKIYEKYKVKSSEMIKNHPFTLVLEDHMPYNIANEIATKNGSDPCSSDRIEASVWEVLTQAEYGGPLFKVGSGSSCVEYNLLLKKAEMLLDYSVDIRLIREACNRLRERKKIVPRQDQRNKNIFYVFKTHVDFMENAMAKQICRILRNYKQKPYNIEEEIRRMETSESVRLAPEQTNAVETALKHGFSVITGGPGTGKTTIIKFIRSIYLKQNPHKKILMCSPTGVAAVRMKESTNGEASTVHKALELKPLDNEKSIVSMSIEELDYDFIIVDETSMLDMYVAYALVRAIRLGAKACFVGDIDQLPSVGPGAILRDIIESGVVPVARLLKVYRQEDGNLIALNAQLIKNGKTTLDYGESFSFIPAATFEEAAEIMKNTYMQEIGMHGIQNVLMLSPYRVKTASCVNAINKIRDIVNPPNPSKKELSFKDKKFRKGDKVINTKNVDDICNGDIGFITDIFLDKDNQQKATIDFGHDRVVSFEQESLEDIDWAYATTVHKSQGSEANYVILNIMDGHAFMLKRNLLYTAITRAKKKVIIIGNKSAVETAILSGVSEEERRKTMVSQRLCYFYNNNNWDWMGE